MPAPRIALAELAPITQRSASTRFDLPQPFGPTTPVSPGSMTNSVGSTKDLNPRTLRRVNFTRPLPARPAGKSPAPHFLVPVAPPALLDLFPRRVIRRYPARI